MHALCRLARSAVCAAAFASLSDARTEQAQHASDSCSLPMQACMTNMEKIFRPPCSTETQARRACCDHHQLPSSKS